jgi:phosphoserine aminotransferase
MSKRPHNFNAGPAILPLSVLENARDNLLETAGTGLSILEWSHRSPDYGEIHAGTEATMRELLGSAFDGYRILFLQGGASLQFAQVPLNLATTAAPGEYVLTGAWSKKALAEAERAGCGRCIWTGQEENFGRLPEERELKVGGDASYVHITSNNTIFGTQWPGFPDTGDVPLVADMSSDILSRPIDSRGFGLIYAGAQKNLGPAGVAVVIMREDLFDRIPEGIPNILNYQVHAKANGLYHTPPTFAVHLMGLVLKWIKAGGGLSAIAQQNEAKASLLYDEIDRSGFYRGTATREHRSLMNVTFRLREEPLESKFLEESKAAGFVGLKGHRSVGGLRASIYNAMPQESIQALVDFMQEFDRTNG